MWSSAIVVFAKTPQPGASKTRLCPPLDFADAAELSRAFICDTAATVLRVAASSETFVQPFVSCAGDAASMGDLVPDAFRIIAQRGTTFGERLANSFVDVRERGYDAVFVIDSDSPTVPDRAYALGVESLANARDRVALGPCADGGYYCIGATRYEPSLFENVEWSTSRVFAQTRAHATTAGLTVDVLPAWYDVDDATSLAVLETELREAYGRPGAPAPVTRACLEELRARVRGAATTKVAFGLEGPR